jgi:hypothetical protein
MLVIKRTSIISAEFSELYIHRRMILERIPRIKRRRFLSLRVQHFYNRKRGKKKGNVKEKKKENAKDCKKSEIEKDLRTEKKVLLQECYDIKCAKLGGR